MLDADADPVPHSWLANVNMCLCQDRFRLLVESDEVLSKWANVPRVVSELSSKEVNQSSCMLAG